MLGLHCCVQAFSSCGARGLRSSWGARASLGGGFSPVAMRGLQGCCTWAPQGAHVGSCWDAHAGSVAPGARGLPGPGIRLVSAAVQGGFSPTGRQGGPALTLLLLLLVYCFRVIFRVTVPLPELMTLVSCARASHLRHWRTAARGAPSV